MGIRVGFGRAGGLAMLMAASVAIGGFPTSPVGATAEPAPPDGSSRPAALVARAGGTWGACGSWWTSSTMQIEFGSVCGVDGVVIDDGRATQLAEPLIQVSRYVCLERGGQSDCSSENFSGTVRRSEMTVDPFLRRATIRGTLDGCALDVEFAGLGPVRPDGNVWESHGMDGATPTVSVGGSHTFTSQASWWGGVCGQTVTPMSQEEGQGWMFRGAEANLSLFGGHSGEGHGVH